MKKLKKYKVCRRLGSPIFEKCQNQQFARSLSRKKMKRPNMSTYNIQLLEKQKTRLGYGISERQLSRYVKEAVAEHGNPAVLLFQKLESRLDNVVYRLGLAKTRRMARQAVSHGHFAVNDKRTRVPSHSIRPGDKITIREGSRVSTMFSNLPERLKDYHLPEWLKFDINNLQGEVTARPTGKEEVAGLDAVLEFYSR
ncbi:30S ribosomal protein S4 [Candidatus Nomurabacteria bacterium RIFCSPHIGHO2_01_FULL_39_9]|uniref:Small ribosomal subunit protein uS4 n=1 Tax=Candidatus Nomurabacteria bacterium RIFCSPHIGHO2_01_FULL_39_9 TaxID=1801735 RepID=A0A1F6UVX2_9BACT|nr:MAG: 30S ribosomal protein S4 [Candidatus Nomurabacteria bacterium RIFCSPHIGHO2_01_FULL_39_9]